MPDKFINDNRGWSPARDHAAITLHDTDELAGGPCKAIWCNTAGDVSIIPADSSTAIVYKVAANSLLPVRARIVKSTGSTVGISLIALY